MVLMGFVVYLCRTGLRQYLLSRNRHDTLFTLARPMQNLTQQNRNDDKISKVIDRVLRQVFGEEATTLIYRHLENKYAVKQDETAKKIDVFAEGLEEFLRSGAYVVEQKILEDIYSNCGLLRRLELERSHDECDFVGQIKLLMERA